MVKLITILLWKVRKSFRSKYQIPQNHTQQLLVCALGGGARSALPLQLSYIFAKKKKKWGWSKDGEGKKKVLMHLRQKPTVKLINDLFGVFKVQKKNPMVQDNLSGCFMGVALLLHSFKQKVGIPPPGR